VSLDQLATVTYGFEEPTLWRRDRKSMITVRADISDGTQPPVVTAEVDAALNAIRATLPDGYRIEAAGVSEESAPAEASIAAGVPVMLLVMLTIIMIQVQDFRRLALVVITAPLGLIGVTAALLVFGQPFGFVATLGVIALGGMIMRNTVILVEQIDRGLAAGQPPRAAIIEATVHRARPVLLTAAAAILAMIPLTQSAFWAPMAVAIMGGLAVATVLTLVVVPALYAVWFKAPAGDTTGNRVTALS
jgi:multidrug efflux pump